VDRDLSQAQETAIENAAFLRLLPPPQREQVVALLVPQSCHFGDVVIAEGSPAEAFRLVVSGRLRVVKKGRGGEEITLNVLKAGDSFGEQALLEGGVHEATVRCSADAELLVIAAADFRTLLEQAPDLRAELDLLRKHRALHNFLREFSRLGNLPLPALRALLEKLEEADAARGAVIFSAGDPPGPFYVLREGRVRVYKSEAGRDRNLSFLRAGDYFGELSILRGAPRSASVAAVTDCRLLVLSQEAVSALMAEYPELRAAFEERAALYDAEHEARIPLDFADELLPAEAAVSNKVEIRAEAAAPEGEPKGEEAPPPEEWGEPFHAPAARIRRVPLVRQIDEMDCGAAALAMVCRHFGKKVPLSLIRQLVHVSTDGTSLMALCSAGEELGLAAKAVKVSRRNLDRMPLPAIVHWEGNHWMVLHDVEEHRVRVADPGEGARTIERGEFEEKWSGYAALYARTARFDTAPEELGTSIAWLKPFLRPHRALFAKILVLAVAAAALGMILPVFTQIVVDRIVGQRDIGLLNTVGLGMLAAIVFMTGSSLVQRYLAAVASVKIDTAVLDHLTRTMLDLPMSYFATRRTGDIQRRLAGAGEIRRFLIESGIGGVLDAAQIAVVLGCMTWYSPRLTGLFVLTVPAYAGLMYFSARVLKPILMVLEESYGRYSSRQIDAIKGIEAVKAAGAEDTLRERMLGEFTALARQQFRGTFMGLAYDGALRLATLVAQALFLFAGALQVLDGGLSLGRFVAFNALVAIAYAPVLGLLGLWDELQRSAVLLNRINDIFENEPEQGRDHQHLAPVPTLEGRVEFRNVGLRFGGPESPLIVQDISLEVPPGRTVAIVGRSGSGKTTLIKCLSGLLEPTEGVVLFDGVDVRTLRYRDLRRQIGIVLQENHLFDDTIARNIALGDPTPDPERVTWAARAANAHDFIVRLPLGYQTLVGETGLALSGGQRQRVAIARALYDNPPVLIFDEATSALDTESESIIQGNLAAMFSGRTVFVIAHRLSTVRNADVIVVLDRGRIVEQGTHEVLMARRGLYFYLCSQQLGG
jgi:ATP-binding cassette subfamily B protein